MVKSLDNSDIIMLISAVVMLVLSMVLLRRVKKKRPKKSYCGRRNGSIVGRAKSSKIRPCCPPEEGMKEYVTVMMPDNTMRCYNNQDACIFDCQRIAPQGVICTNICADVPEK